MSREIFALHGVVSALGLGGVVKGLNQLESHYIKAEKALTKFGRQSVKLGTILSKNITAPLVALGAAAAVATAKTMDYAEKMVKLEGVTGLTTDTLQELQHVSKMMGVDFETMTGAVGQFAKKLPSIAKEGGPAFDALKQLGVNIYDSSVIERLMNIELLLCEGDLLKEISVRLDYRQKTLYFLHVFDQHSNVDFSESSEAINKLLRFFG
jgi:hypothetical protein